MISEVCGADLFFRIGGLNLKLPKDGLDYEKERNIEDRLTKEEG